MISANVMSQANDQFNHFTIAGNFNGLPKRHISAFVSARAPVAEAFCHHMEAVITKAFDVMTPLPKRY